MKYNEKINIINKVIKSILNQDDESDKLTKNIDELKSMVMKGRKPAEIGEIRDWASGKQIKTNEGWKPYTEGDGKPNGQENDNESDKDSMTKDPKQDLLDQIDSMHPDDLDSFLQDQGLNPNDDLNENLQKILSSDIEIDDFDADQDENFSGDIEDEKYNTEDLVNQLGIDTTGMSEQEILEMGDILDELEDHIISSGIADNYDDVMENIKIGLRAGYNVDEIINLDKEDFEQIKSDFRAEEEHNIKTKNSDENYEDDEIVSGYKDDLAKLDRRLDTSMSPVLRDKLQAQRDQLQQELDEYIGKSLDDLTVMKDVDENLKSDIMTFLIGNPNPTDDEVHEFAVKLGYEKDEVEEVIYSILGSIIGEGVSGGEKDDVDPDELSMGIDIEIEHTGDRDIAEKIARDHLAENPTYYSDLANAGID